MSESMLRRVFIFQNGGGEPIEVYIKLTTDSIATLNNTIANCADNSIIYFEEGLHVCDDAIFVGRSNIRLEGVSGKTILQNNVALGANGLLQLKGSANDSRIYNIEISGFVIDGNQNASKSGHGIEVKYCGIGFNNTTSAYNSAIVGASYQNQNGVVISDMIVKNNSLHGVVVYNSDNVMVEKCNVLNNVQNGIYLYVDSNNCKLLENIVQNNNAYGIYISNSSNNNIIGNTIQNNNGSGLFLSTASNNNLIGNTIQNNNGNGIYLRTISIMNVVIGNTVQNNSSRGIYINTSSKNEIVGNTVQNNGNQGIYLYNAGDNNVVSGNTIQNNAGYGIYLNAASKNIVSSNISRANTTYDISVGTSTCVQNTLSFNQTSLAIVNAGTSTTIDGNVTG